VPFINGRYHINPIMGNALESARAASEASASANNPTTVLESDADDLDSVSNLLRDLANEKGPIHHIDIEAAEVVPNSTGRAARGFVARVHRTMRGTASCAVRPGVSPTLRPETHVFTDHRDLVDFLRGELAHDSANRQADR
jgi:hypothetical protein